MNTFSRLSKAAMALSVAACVSFAAPAAFAAEGDSRAPFSYANPGDGLTKVVPGPDGDRYTAGSYIVHSQNTNIVAFDVEFPTQTSTNAEFIPSPWSESGIAEIARVADIAARHNSIGSPYSDARWEAAATQLAIWSLTNGVDPVETGNAEFAARAQALVDGSTPATEPNFMLDVNASARANDYGMITVEVAVADSQGLVPGQPVRVSVGDADLMGMTDDSGVAFVDVPKKFAGETATVSATTKAPAGVFLKASGGASLITASAAPVMSLSSVALPGVEAIDAAVSAAKDSAAAAVDPVTGEPVITDEVTGERYVLDPVTGERLPVDESGSSTSVTFSSGPVTFDGEDVSGDGEPVAVVSEGVEESYSSNDADNRGKGKDKDTAKGSSKAAGSGGSGSRDGNDVAASSAGGSGSATPSELPRTGSDSSPALIAAFAGVAALAAAGVAYSRRRVS